MNSDQFIMHSRPSMKGEFIKTEHFEIKIIDGVLEVSFSERLDLTLPIAKNFVKERLLISANRALPMLMDVRNIKSIDKESRDYLSHKSNNMYVSAGAMLVCNEIQRLLGMIFIFYYSVTIPYKLFETKEQAYSWLCHFKSLN